MVIMNSAEFQNPRTARGNTVAHNKAREVCRQKTADIIFLSGKILHNV